MKKLLEAPVRMAIATLELPYKMNDVDLTASTKAKASPPPPAPRACSSFGPSAANRRRAERSQSGHMQEANAALPVTMLDNDHDTISCLLFYVFQL